MIFGVIPADSLAAGTLQMAVLLLPGYLALKVRDGLVEQQRRPAADAWLPALLLDLPVFMILLLVAKIPGVGITPTLSAEGFEPVTILYALGVGILVGAVAGWIEGHRHVHKALQAVGATQKGWVSAWADGFLHAQDCGADWAIVHVKDGTRYFGRPEFVSVDGKESTIMLTRLVKKDGTIDPVSVIGTDGVERAINGPGILLSPKAEITRVDFVD